LLFSSETLEKIRSMEELGGGQGKGAPLPDGERIGSAGVEAAWHGHQGCVGGRQGGWESTAPRGILQWLL